ncbi:hypothetical protein KG112_17490 [Nocardioides sp. zg-ZUI104]|uniref:hypothetical protein n=1 Tax=Nocardioides faecalis TaxID=2803858 RepID=UPI001BCF6E3D|nr:hypothetical protein [Nocardioides faecalis]MBS4754604.1 hypothetical protein [Nocardioides faecalis]
MTLRRWSAASVAGLALALAASPAIAETLDVHDESGDALAITDYGIAYGDFDIDLRNVRIDHGTRNLQIVSTFTYLDATSWHYYVADVDTNADGVADHRLVWDRDAGFQGVAQVDLAGNATAVTCTTAGGQEKLGVNGTLTFTVPRTCVGSPAQLAVNVTVMWSGQSEADTDLAFVDTAPGMFGETPTFSAPVRSSNTGTITSPQAPQVRTSISASVAKTKYKAKSKPPKVTFKVPQTSGSVKIQVDGRTKKTVRVAAGRRYSYQLPRLKRGAHTVKLTFTPTQGKRYLGSTKTLRVRVVK